MILEWSNNRPTHVGAKAANVFGQAVDHEIGSECQRSLAIRRGEGVIDDHQQSIRLSYSETGFVHPATDQRDVDQIERGRHRGFKITHTSPTGDGRFEATLISQISKFRRYAEPRQPVCHQAVGTTVESVMRDNLSA